MFIVNAKNDSWRDDAALERFQMIAPLLEEMDNAKKIQCREMIAQENDISTRSLYRYEEAYRKKGFEGLKPSSREKHYSQKLPENFAFLLEQAIQLRKEVPKRSVETIIYILEAEGHVAPGLLKRSTLERHLYKAGFGTAHMKMYEEARQSSSKRYCKPHRMMLIQGDIKYGPSLPIGKNGAKVKTYLSSALDDHSRYLLHSRFYAGQEETIVEETFRQAVLHHGRFDACYFDNGKQYVAKQLKFSLAKLGIRVCHARIRSGKSKGKIEKFHRVVDSFLRESKLKKVTSLDELNRYWSIYLEEYYHKDPHEGIREYYRSLGVDVPAEGITPLQEWNRDSRPLVFLDASVVAEAFLHHEKRKVDKGACISFRGMKYETRPSLIGFTVEIAYDPGHPETIIISHPGMLPFTARPMKIGSFCDKEPSLPVSMLAEEPTTSRLLDALEKKQEQSKAIFTDAISYAGYRKDGE